ncbi:MAG TPA: glycerate kinase [Chthoniobacterales bacterium]|jgi:glycerate kinase
MRILIAPDKFKGTLSASQVAKNIAAGLREVLPQADLEIVPVADGGEGTAEVICQALSGEWVVCEAHDPFGNGISARYAWMKESATAVMEMSEAAGLRRLRDGALDPLRATTFGVGEMLRAAARDGAREIIVGLGGSVTNDGGFGMARALGVRFFAGEEELKNGPPELDKLTGISQPKDLHLPPIIAAVDVRNQLLGARGATRVFGPQKGVRPEQLKVLERALRRLADQIAVDLGCDFRNEPGAGAAGGLGFGLMSFCQAQLRNGFDVVADAIDLDRKIARADVVVTGEGRFDAQTLEGKGPAGVARLARRHRKPVFAIVGQADPKVGSGELFDGIYELARPPITKIEAVKLTVELIRERAREAAVRLRGSK